MKHKRPYFLFLMLTLLVLAACNPAGSTEPAVNEGDAGAEQAAEPTAEVVADPTAEVEAEPTAVVEADPGAADECAAAGDGTHQLIAAAQGICFLYPDTYDVAQGTDGSLTLYVGSLMNTEAPLASVRMVALDGRSIQEVIPDYPSDADLAAMSFLTIDLGGEMATVLDILPGQDTNRRVFAVHDGVVLDLMIARIGEEYGAVGEEAEALYNVITSSFQFIDVEPEAPLLIDGSVVAPAMPDSEGGLAPVANFEGTLAYIQDKALIIQRPDGEQVSVETCPPDAYCITQYLKWAPDGRHLLYYYYDGENDSLRLADPFGQIQVVTEDIAFAMPGDWSPDGQAVVFLRPTGEQIDGTETTPPLHVHEVWTAVLDASGTVQEPQLVGRTNRLGDGCGGGGRSASEVLYENEGGTAYGYLMGVMEWTASGTLLYTNNCTNIGINRFDLNSAVDLPPFERVLRNLIVDESGSQWYAVTGPTWSTEAEDHRIATGKPEETAVAILPTQNPVELLFYGSQSDRLYYTTREFVENAEIPDLGAYFNFFKSALWQINRDGSGETLLWQGEDQAYAQVSETANGDLIFVLIENDRPLYEALQNGSATMDEMGEFAPQRHIMRLSVGGEPQMVLRNAGQPAIAPVVQP